MQRVDLWWWGGETLIRKGCAVARHAPRNARGTEVKGSIADKGLPHNKPRIYVGSKHGLALMPSEKSHAEGNCFNCVPIPLRCCPNQAQVIINENLIKLPRGPKIQ